MKSFIKGRKNTVWILLGILAISLLFLFTNVREGFATNTVELFHHVPASGATASDKEFKIPSSIITTQTGKNLKGIKLQRYDKTNGWVDINMANFAGTNATFPSMTLTAGGKTGLRNCSFARKITNNEAKLPLATSDPIFKGDILLKNLDSNPLGITTTNYQKDSNGKNLKIILYFTDDALSSISTTDCLKA